LPKICELTKVFFTKVSSFKVKTNGQVVDRIKLALTINTYP